MKLGLIVLLCTLHLSYIDAEPMWCDPWPLGCYYCNKSQAHCLTTNRSEVVPQVLNKSLDLLVIFYEDLEEGTVQLSRPMLCKYGNLSVVKFSGDISSVAADALVDLPRLTLFCLIDTKVGFLPDNLFHQNPQLIDVLLDGNKLEDFPYRAFNCKSTVNLKRLRLTRNAATVKMACSNKTQLILPKGLSCFSKLDSLDLSYSTFGNSSCSQQLDIDVFEAVQGVEDLSLSGTNLFEFGQSDLALRKMASVHTLRIDKLPPYNYCPAKASKLLSNLPPKIAVLSMQHWESLNHEPDNCVFTNDSLVGLERLKNLRELYLTYADQAFGFHLRASKLPSLPNLEVLDLGYCRFSFIHQDAFKNYGGLKTLSLEGNQLGSRNYTLTKLPGLKKINLARTGIRSDDHNDYVISELICSFPNLTAIDLSNNLLAKMPRFSQNSSCNAQGSQFVHELRLTNNSLWRFTEKTESGLANICHAFPNLTMLDIQSNRLADTRGLELCKQLRFLDLSGNHLGFAPTSRGLQNHTANTDALKHLDKLVTLRLSANKLRSVDPDLLACMVNLREVKLSGNALEELNDTFFKYNTKLRNIDISWNFIQELSVEMFASLAQLRRLDIYANHISALSPEFLKMIDDNNTFVTIGDNPYQCGCTAAYFAKWLNSTRSIYQSDLKFIKCSSPTYPYNLANQLVYKCDMHHFYCEVRPWLIDGGCILAGLIMATLLVMPAVKYRWYLRHIRIVWRALGDRLQAAKFEYSCPYDAFVSFNGESEADSWFVQNQLIPSVEGDLDTPNSEEGYKLFISARDAVADESRAVTRDNALEQSRKIIVVLSNSYVSSTQCLAEADLTAYEKHGRNFYQPDRVLVLVIEELNEDVLREPLRSLLIGNVLQAKTTNERTQKILWQRVRQFLAQPSYIYQRPGRTRSATPELQDPMTLNERTPLMR